MEADLAALRAQVQALTKENEWLKERCDVLEPLARNYNPQRLRADAAEARLATLAAVVREVEQEMGEVAHEPGCPAIVSADASECACIAAAVARWCDKLRAALPKEEQPLSLISSIIDLDEWPCGCWQIVGHSTIHTCSDHQHGLLPDDYWHTHKPRRKQARLLEEEATR